MKVLLNQDIPELSLGVAVDSWGRLAVESGHSGVPGGDDLSSESRGADTGPERELESQVSLHSMGESVEEMSGKSCISLPFLCMVVWGILSALIIAVLSYFLNRCSNRTWSYTSSSDCSQSGTQISETNVDLFNLDISGKDIVEEARQAKCDCSLEVLEWSLFEITVVALLLLILFYLSGTDGASHILKFWRKRNSDEGRLQRELEQLESRQSKLIKKLGKPCVEANAQMQTGEATAQASTFSAL